MPTGYTPTTTYHSSLILPVNGDAATAPSVNDAALKYLADNAAYLKPLVDARYTWRLLTPYDLNTTINPRSDSTSGRNVIDALVLTGNRTITIVDTGCADGDWIYVRNGTIGFTMAIVSPAAVTLATLGDAGSGSDDDWAIFIRDGGTWRVFSSSLYNSGFSTSGLTVRDSVAVGGSIFATAISLIGAIGAATGNFSGALTTDSLAVAASATIGGSLSAVGSLTASTLYGIFGGGYTANTYTDTNQMIGRNAISVFAGGGAANFTWTIFGIGQQDGDWALVRSNSTGNCTVKDPAGNTLAILNGFTGANAFVIRIAGVWYVAFS